MPANAPSDRQSRTTISTESSIFLVLTLLPTPDHLSGIIYDVGSVRFLRRRRPSRDAPGTLQEGVAMPKTTSPIDHQRGRAPLRRDAQQWILDYLIQETGKVFHFQSEGRGELPKSVRSHAMISKHLGQGARKLETLADTEYGAGHRETALGVYYRATWAYARAQHPIFELNYEKRFLYAGVQRCYDKVAELAPYPLEHVDVAREGSTVSGNLHINPHVSGPAPLLFYIPGCDSFKEGFPHPQFNVPHQRGMHVFSFDGPGQPESNLRGIKLTADNYERAATTGSRPSPPPRPRCATSTSTPTSSRRGGSSCSPS